MSQPDSPAGSGQTEADELRAQLWKVFKSTPENNDGRGTINHFFDVLVPFIERYSHHQTEQVLAGVLDKLIALSYLSQSNPAIEREVLRLLRDVKAELGLLKEQSLPTNKDKEQ